MNEAEKEAYRKSLAEQLEKWVSGKSTHCKISEECCPDFSCCRPELKWPEEKRRAFVEADEQTRNKMLSESLRALLKAEKVHVIG